MIAEYNADCEPARQFTVTADTYHSYDSNTKAITFDTIGYDGLFEITLGLTDTAGVISTDILKVEIYSPDAGSDSGSILLNSATGHKLLPVSRDCTISSMFVTYASCSQSTGFKSIGFNYVIDEHCKAPEPSLPFSVQHDLYVENDLCSDIDITTLNSPDFTTDPISEVYFQKSSTSPYYLDGFSLKTASEVHWNVGNVASNID